MPKKKKGGIRLQKRIAMGERTSGNPKSKMPERVKKQNKRNAAKSKKGY